MFMSKAKKMTVQEAIRVLAGVGAVFSLPSENHLSVKSVAGKLNCSVAYVRKHLAEFPNAWRMSGGDLRVPVRDVEGFAERLKIRENGTKAR